MTAEPTTSKQACGAASSSSSNRSCAEVLLTEVDVRQHKLYHAFQNKEGNYLGGYYKHHLTIYPAYCGRLGSGTAIMQDIEHELEGNPFLAAFPRKRFEYPWHKQTGKSTHFDVLHLYGPPDVNELIRQQGGWTQRSLDYQQHKLHGKFETGHYRDLGRRAPCPPDRWGVLDERVIALLEERKRLDDFIRSRESAIDIEMAGKAQAQRTIRKKTLLEDAEVKTLYARLADDAAKIKGFGYDDLREGWKQLCGSLRYVPPGERKGINDEIVQLILPDTSVEATAPVDCKSRQGYFTPTRMLTPTELRKMRWLVLDTESVFFRQGCQTVTHIPYAIVQDGKVLERVIMTTDNPGAVALESKQGNVYTVRAYDTGTLAERSERMILDFAAVARAVPVLCAYNAAYDLPTLNDEGDFRVGNRDSRPRKEVTQPFFVRVGVAGKRVIDPMRIAKMMVPHLVNAKADNVLAYLLGTEAFKTISHDELGPLAAVAQGQDARLTQNCRSLVCNEVGAGLAAFDGLAGDVKSQAAARVINRYAVNDVDYLVQAVFGERIYHKALHAAYHLGTLFGSDYNKLLHLPSSINAAQDWCYFMALGLWRSMVYLPTKDMKRREAQARGRFKDHLVRSIGQQGEDGLYDGLVLCRLPVAERIEPFVAKNFPDAMHWFEAIHRNWDKEDAAAGRPPRPAEESFFNVEYMQDPVYRQFLNSYGDSLCKLLVADVGTYMQAAAAFSRATKGRVTPDFMRYECKLQRMLRGVKGLNPAKGDLAYQLRKRALPVSELARVLGPQGLLQFESSYLKSSPGKKKSAERTFYEKRELQKKINEYYTTAYGGTSNPLQAFHADLCLYESMLDKIAKVGGNFGIDADHVIGEIEALGNRVSAFAKKHNIEIVHKDGHYLYVKPTDEAGRRAVRFKNAPWMALDDIPRALVSSTLGERRIFYKQRGFYKGLKIIENPTWHLCIAEARLYDDVLWQALEGDVPQALADGREGLERLIRDGLDPRKVREFIFQSNSSPLRYFLGVDPDVALRDGKWYASQSSHDLFRGNKPNFNKVFYYECSPAELGYAKKDGRWQRQERLLREDITTIIRPVRVGNRHVRVMDESYSRALYDQGRAHTTHHLEKRRRWFLHPSRDTADVQIDVSQYALRAQERLCGLLAPFGVHAKHWLALRYWCDSLGRQMCVDLENPLLPIDDVKQLTFQQEMLFEGAPKEVRRVNVKRTIENPLTASKKPATKKPAIGKRSSGTKSDGTLFPM